MTRPDPKSFDTLEKAQAEIARLNGVLDRASARADGIASELERLVPEINTARADIARVLGETK